MASTVLGEESFENAKVTTVDRGHILERDEPKREVNVSYTLRPFASNVVLATLRSCDGHDPK